MGLERGESRDLMAARFKLDQLTTDVVNRIEADELAGRDWATPALRKLREGRLIELSEEERLAITLLAGYGLAAAAFASLERSEAR
jgi:hypothetical protein